MKRRLLISLLTVGIGTTIALMALAAPDRGNPSTAQARVAGFQPDTSSPNWKLLASDVGVMIRDDEQLGLRGRLYVRVDGAWLPVATDGPGDTVESIPVR